MKIKNQVYYLYIQLRIDCMGFVACLAICCILAINPLMLMAANIQPDNFDEIFEGKAKLRKYLNEKCS